MQDLDSPRLKKSLPRYLSLDESIQLLEAVDEPNQERDYCILTLFLNCGLRISELVALDIDRCSRRYSSVCLGKGNKERMMFLNEACRAALDDWLEERSRQAAADPNALFLTQHAHTRMTNGCGALHGQTAPRQQPGWTPALYSSHKLRHTAATLMLQNGVDVRTLAGGVGTRTPEHNPDLYPCGQRKSALGGEGKPAGTNEKEIHPHSPWKIEIGGRSL